jgi:hypothetical protein
MIFNPIIFHHQAGCTCRMRDPKEQYCCNKGPDHRRLSSVPVNPRTTHRAGAAIRTRFADEWPLPRRALGQHGTARGRTPVERLGGHDNHFLEGPRPLRAQQNAFPHDLAMEYTYFSATEPSRTAGLGVSQHNLFWCRRHSPCGIRIAVPCYLRIDIRDQRTTAKSGTICCASHRPPSGVRAVNYDRELIGNFLRVSSITSKHTVSPHRTIRCLPKYLKVPFSAPCSKPDRSDLGAFMPNQGALFGGTSGQRNNPTAVAGDSNCRVP